MSCLIAGCTGPAFSPPPKEQTAESGAAGGDGEGGENAVAEQPKPNAFQREAKLVDRHVFMAEHPNAIEREKNVIEATGYLSAVSQGYFAAASQVTILQLQHDLQLQKQLNNDKWPTFDAYKKILDTHGVKLKGLRKTQVYAYDDQTGNISILELPEGEELPE
ncbi:MAG: hypothetical protein R3B90_00855 [Planctomycetaceae bacterium]